ncbi:glycosyltransferase [Roseomonas sp. OT10]|uniref:glycosyltransferase n=1 Tax=Roseomonas cutis TaxID=2897332 RepID=UPI001E47CD10|nr:glycosyltransferase [Roseomonas sp. OT10]UFN46903.1 glycosyltransferase [Roseomonas sp. OT10]
MTSPCCVVCIPARNEAASLPGLLSALDRQAWSGGPLRVVLLANNCTDGTAGLARSLAETRRGLALRVLEADLPPERATVGVAREMALRAGAAWLREDGVRSGVLVTTDADAQPPPCWIAATLEAMDGVEMVGGEIRLAEAPGSPLPTWLRDSHARVARYWAAVRALAHRIDPLPHDPPPRHGDHTGASLAVALRAYEAAGGVPPLATGEDNALVAAVERQGGRLRHPPTVWTAVSVREDGRAPGGMASELRRWRGFAEGAAPHLLPDATSWLRSLARRRALRDGFHGGLSAAAAAIGVASARLEAVARESVNDIAFVARAEPLLPPLPCTEQEIAAATAAIEALARRQTVDEPAAA